MGLVYVVVCVCLIYSCFTYYSGEARSATNPLEESGEQKRCVLLVYYCHYVSGVREGDNKYGHATHTYKN